MIITPHVKMRRVSWTVPVLSAQLMTAPTGRPSEMRNLAPDEPPRPKRRQEQSNPSVLITPPLCERDSDPSNLNLSITGHNEDRDIQSPCPFADTDVRRVKILSLTVLSFAEKMSRKFLINQSWFYLRSCRKINTNFSKTKEQCRHLNCSTDAFTVGCFQRRTNTDRSNSIFEAMIAFLIRAALGA